MLRKKELPIEPDTEEAGRLEGGKDGASVERKCLPWGRVCTGEVEELAFRRLEDDASRSSLRFNRSLRLSKEAVVEARRAADGEEVRVVRESEGNNPSVTTEGLVK